MTGAANCRRDNVAVTMATGPIGKAYILFRYCDSDTLVDEPCARAFACCDFISIVRSIVDRKLPTFDCAREEVEDIENGSRSNRSAHEQFEDPISPPFHGGGDQVVAISEMDVKSATRTSRAGADGVETRNIEPFLGEGPQRGIDEGVSCPTLCELSKARLLVLGGGLSGGGRGFPSACLRPCA